MFFVFLLSDISPTILSSDNRLIFIISFTLLYATLFPLLFLFKSFKEQTMEIKKLRLFIERLLFVDQPNFIVEEEATLIDIDKSGNAMITKDITLKFVSDSIAIIRMRAASLGVGDSFNSVDDIKVYNLSDERYLSWIKSPQTSDFDEIIVLLDPIVNRNNPSIRLKINFSFKNIFYGLLTENIDSGMLEIDENVNHFSYGIRIPNNFRIKRFSMMPKIGRHRYSKTETQSIVQLSAKNPQKRKYKYLLEIEDKNE